MGKDNASHECTMKPKNHVTTLLITGMYMPQPMLGPKKWGALYSLRTILEEKFVAISPDA